VGVDANVGYSLDAHFYNNFMRELSDGIRYTVVFSTTPSDDLTADEITYEPTFDVGVHMDLKRALLTRAPASTTSNDTRPLFEKYQYFTPGLSPFITHIYFITC
jgi:hypothetical protein